MAENNENTYPCIVGTADGFVDVKRFYIPGIEVRDKCPKCGTLVVHDMSAQYLSYPDIGTPIKCHMYCQEEVGDETCDTSWSVLVKLKIELEIAQ